MVEIEHTLRNYLVSLNDLDLGFAIDLKIGKRPDVLEGKFEDKFKTKTVSFLKKINGNVRKAAELMLKQCKERVEKNCKK